MLESHSWSQKEFEAKAAAVTAPSKAALSMVQSKIKDQYDLVDNSQFTAADEFAYHLDALSHILVYLKFPDGLRGFLDTLLALSRTGKKEFKAQNWEVGSRSHSGRDACTDSSMEKWVSRKKKQLAMWQTTRRFEIVSWVDGEFNFKTNKRTPTVYKVDFNKYILEAVTKAKSKWYWRSGSSDRSRKLQGRALREAARAVIDSIPNAPNLKLKIKTVPKDQIFNQRWNRSISGMEKCADDIDAENGDIDQVIDSAIIELERIRAQHRGTVGKLLNEKNKNPRRNLNFYELALRGDLTQVIQKDLPEENKETAVVSRYWRDGEFADTSNTIETSAETLSEGQTKVSDPPESVHTTEQGDPQTFLSDPIENTESVCPTHPQTKVSDPIQKDLSDPQTKVSDPIAFEAWKKEYVSIPGEIRDG